MHPDALVPLRVPGVLRPADRVYVPVRPLDPEFDEPFFFRARPRPTAPSLVAAERAPRTRG